MSRTARSHRPCSVAAPAPDDARWLDPARVRLDEGFQRERAAPNSQTDRIRFDCRPVPQPIPPAPLADAKGVALRGPPLHSGHSGPSEPSDDAVDLPDPWDTTTGDTLPGAA